MDDKRSHDKLKHLFDKLVKTVTKFMKVRRTIKIIFAFVMGVSTGIAFYRQLYKLIENRPLSVYYAVLGGAAATAFALLFMEVIRKLIGVLKKIGAKLIYGKAH